MNGDVTRTSLGMGNYRVVLEITREDGRVDKFEVYKLAVRDVDNAELVVEEEYEDIFSRHVDMVMAPPKRTITLALEGEPLHREPDGELFRFTQNISEEEKLP